VIHGKVRLREIRWHRALCKGRDRSGVVLVLWSCDPGNKNDYSTVSITNTGCLRCDNRCRVPCDGKHFFFD
jgi:hypothetical protein